jgi:hypothetical protein
MTADDITRCLAANLFASDLVVVDRCTWPGAECDLLVVTNRCQVIDVEIKISRADLKADREKSKWYRQPDYLWREDHGPPMPKNMPLDWPKNVWKHYYAVPASLWRPEFVNLIKHASGVITVDVARAEASERRREAQALKPPSQWFHKVVRRAKPNPNYAPLEAGELRKVAHLTSFRLWRCYDEMQRMSDDHKRILALARTEGNAA